MGRLGERNRAKTSRKHLMGEKDLKGWGCRQKWGNKTAKESKRESSARTGMEKV